MIESDKLHDSERYESRKETVTRSIEVAAHRIEATDRIRGRVVREGCSEIFQERNTRLILITQDVRDGFPVLG